MAVNHVLGSIRIVMNITIDWWESIRKTSVVVYNDWLLKIVIFYISIIQNLCQNMNSLQSNYVVVKYNSWRLASLDLSQGSITFLYLYIQIEALFQWEVVIISCFYHLQR